MDKKPYEYYRTRDIEHEDIFWIVSAVPDTNEIEVTLFKGDINFTERVASPFVDPAMIDRCWGIDVRDKEVAVALSDRMWEKYSEQLLGAQ